MVRTIRNRLSLISTPAVGQIRADSLAVTLLFAGLVVALPTLPARIGHAANAQLVEASSGYRTDVAYLIVVVAASLAVVAGLLLSRNDGTPLEGIERPVTGRLRLLELVTVAAAAFLFYCPLFLSRYGPYLEDSYFLTVLQRMVIGQNPYTDFETQYGPLMLLPAKHWLSKFGFSMKSYYTYLAVLEAINYVLLLAVLQYLIPGRKKRFIAFLVIAVVLFNDNLGISWNGLRRLVPILTLILFAARPTSPRVLVGGSILLGLLLAYSPEFGAAAVIAAVAAYGALAVSRHSIVETWRGFFVLGAALITWLVGTILMLGDRFPDYIRETAAVMSRRSGGEAGFPFSWNLNSLAVMVLLMTSALVLGRGLHQTVRGTPLRFWDFFFLAGFFYAMVALKSGLARSDMYHLSAPALAFIAAFLLPTNGAVFRVDGRTRSLALVMIGTLSVTYALGLSGIGLAFTKGWLSGARDVVLRVPTESETEMSTRGPSVLLEQSYPSSHLIELAEYLAGSERHERPVVYYGSTWSLDKLIGVPKVTFPSDDYLMTDLDGEQLGRFLKEHTEAFVLINVSEYEQLQGGPHPNTYGSFLFFGRPLGRFLYRVSSSHYGPAVRAELAQKQNRWARTVGKIVQKSFRPGRRFGSILVLEHEPTTGTSEGSEDSSSTVTSG